MGVGVEDSKSEADRGTTKPKGGGGGEATNQPSCIGYRISIKQTEIPWEKSHPAPLD